jgi:putative transposase
MQRHALTDAQWAKLQTVLPKQKAGRHSRNGDRMFIDAVLYRAKTGIQWRDLPERFGKWKTVYNRFSNWAQRGWWEQIFKALQLQVDESHCIIDGSYVRAHQDAAGGKGGSEKMLWAIVEAAFQAKFMHSLTPKPSRSISHSVRAKTTI